LVTLLIDYTNIFSWYSR